MLHKWLSAPQATLESLLFYHLWQKLGEMAGGHRPPPLALWALLTAALGRHLLVSWFTQDLVTPCTAAMASVSVWRR